MLKNNHKCSASFMIVSVCFMHLIRQDFSQPWGSMIDYLGSKSEDMGSNHSYLSEQNHFRTHEKLTWYVKKTISFIGNIISYKNNILLIQHYGKGPMSLSFFLTFPRLKPTVPLDYLVRGLIRQRITSGYNI